MFKISEFDKLIKFYELIKKKDEYGGFNVELKLSFKAWGYVTPIVPGLVARGLRKPLPWNYKLLIRYDIRLREDMILEYSKRLYSIEHMNEAATNANFTELYLMEHKYASRPKT